MPHVPHRAPPSSSKHCAVCGRCVKLLDHHCILINNCVGLRNRHAFIMFLTVALSTHLYYLWVTVSCWSSLEKLYQRCCRRQSGLALGRISCGATQRGSAWSCFTYGACYSRRVCGCRSCGLFHATLTANEQIGSVIRTFMQRSKRVVVISRAFLNRFDRGVLRNWAAFLYDGCEGITLQVEKSLGHARLHTA